MLGFPSTRFVIIELIKYNWKIILTIVVVVVLAVWKSH